MRKLLIAASAVALLCGSPALAQTTSDSNSGAVSGSLSGASNNNSTTNGAQTTTVAPVNNGNGDSRAVSGSTANSGSDSHSNATGGTSGASATSTGGMGGTGGQGGTGGASQASSGATNAGNAQDITFNSPAVPTRTTTTVRAAPTVYAPALTTTLTETCMGSSSASGSGVGFGFSLGSTWHDRDCVRRLNAREMAQTLGDREAARALMCEDENVRKAYESVGEPCNVQATPKSAMLSAPMSAAAAPPAPTPQPVPNDSYSKPPAAMAPIPNPQSGERD